MANKDNVHTEMPLMLVCGILAGLSHHWYSGEAG